MRRAKIVATIGPATASPERIRELVEAGMDVARLNLSHGERSAHEASYHAVRRAGDETGRAVGVLVDLPGPKIRTGVFAEGPVQLRTGDPFTVTTRDVPGTREIVSTGYAGLPGDVHPGDRILLDDGKIALVVDEVDGTEVHCVVGQGGRLSDHKGINLPGVPVSVPALSDRDADDLRWALRLRVDFVALSFVRSAADVDAVHAVMDEVGIHVPVIAKIEKPQAVEALEAVVDAFDGIMVARGDLGVEMALEDVPIVQKEAVELARAKAKPVIVATQVLESMVASPRPTRAEASDAANAVLDGADAIMLSGETAVGQYPVDAVRTMARIIEATEEHGLERMKPPMTEPTTIGGLVSRAAAEVAERIHAAYLVAFTQSGDSARRLARVRPRIPLLAFTPVQETRSLLSLVWGIETFLGDTPRGTDDYAVQVEEALLSAGRVRIGDLVVIVAGSPPGISGATNALRVHRVGTAVRHEDEPGG